MNPLGYPPDWNRSSLTDAADEHFIGVALRSKKGNHLHPFVHYLVMSPPRVTFCFLVTGELAKEHLWRIWFDELDNLDFLEQYADVYPNSPMFSRSSDVMFTLWMNSSAQSKFHPHNPNFIRTIQISSAQSKFHPHNPNFIRTIQISSIQSINSSAQYFPLNVQVRLWPIFDPIFLSKDFCSKLFRVLPDLRKAPLKKMHFQNYSCMKCFLDIFKTQ
jgi:hypothetical protein